MRFAFTILLVGILFLSFVTVFHPIETCSAAGEALHVGIGQTYSNIQDAINAANESDTVYVHSGIYSENLTIEKSINIISTGGSSAATINNSNTDLNTIEIKANGINISGFTIKQTGSSYSCIILNSVSDCTIKNNIIKDADGANGIYLINSGSNTIQDNTIENNYIGIYLESNSNANTIKSNDIQNNVMYGMFVTVSSIDNTIYLNDFSDNYDSNARDHGSNNWDYVSQGNYWDDYNDYDNNSDGIGDRPYIIEGDSGNQDNYPLGDFLSEDPTARIDSISPNPASEGTTVNFKGHGSDDGSIVNWEWKANGVILSTDSEDYSTSSLSPGTYTISYRVQDNDGYWSSVVERMLVINSPNQIPTAYILDPTTAVTKYYGEDITFLGDWSDDGEVVEFSWRSDVDGNLSESIQFTKNDLKVEQHTIYFKVRDDYGEWSSEVSIVVTILSNLSNNPPFADAGGHYTGYANQSITFDGSGSYDPDDGDNITIYQWDFGDGSTGEGVSPDHTYTSEGNYTVELTVIDGHDEQNKNTTYANISIQSNGQNGNVDEDDGFPGFELIFVLIASIIALFWIKKRKGN